MSHNPGSFKKVLVIAYYFPPLGMGGVQRVSKFVKYLPSVDWEPVVLTVKDIDYFSYDPSLLEELHAEVKIYKTGSFDPLRLIYLSKRLFKKEKGDPNPALGGTGGVALRNTRGEKSNRFFPRQRRGQNDSSFFSSFFRFVNLLFIPDNKIGWLPFALIKGIRICKKEKIDLLFSTSPPLTCHLTGFLLKKITGISWVADYRDPYMTYQEGKSSTTFKKMLLEKLQKLFLREGDRFIGVTQTIASELEKIYPQARKVEVLPSGYDQKDFEQKPFRRDDVFKIIYFGTFSPDCPAEPFLRALHNLLQTGKLDKKKVKFVHVGFSMGIDTPDLVAKFGLDEVTEFKGYLSHKEGIKELLGADLGLLTLAEPLSAIIPGKAYEYIGAQKPVLAIVPLESETGKLIESLSAGKVVSPDDISGIEEAIFFYYQGFRRGEGSLRTDSRELKKLEKRHLIGRLAQIFAEASNK